MRTQNKKPHQATGHSESLENNDLTMPSLDPHMPGHSKGEHIKLNECDSVAQDSEHHFMDTSFTGQLECLRVHIHT